MVPFSQALWHKKYASQLEGRIKSKFLLFKITYFPPVIERSKIISLYQM